MTVCNLPTELLALIAGFATKPSLTVLAQVSSTMYSLSMKPLYQWIPTMDAVRTLRCLHTLSFCPHLARLICIYAIEDPEEMLRKNSILSSLVSYALENMTNLAELSIQLGVACTSIIFRHVTFKLRKLVCVLESSSLYPVSRFLESQSAIESLYVVCRPQGLAALDPDALPALRSVAAPLTLLPFLLPSRLSILDRISCLGSIYDRSQLRQLAEIFRRAPTSRPSDCASLELVIGLDISPHEMYKHVGIELSLLGHRVPWVGFLRLEVHSGLVDRRFKSAVSVALLGFQNLHTLVLISQSPVLPRRGAYIQPDFLHTTSEHKASLFAWRLACPNLKRVVFPVGVYTYVKKTTESSMTCSKADCRVCKGLSETKVAWNLSQRAVSSAQA